MTGVLLENVNGRLGVVHEACAASSVWTIRVGTIALSEVHEVRCVICSAWIREGI